MVIAPVAPVQDDRLSLPGGLEILALALEDLQSGERLGCGAGKTRPEPAHRLADPELATQSGERTRRVGRPEVGVETTSFASSLRHPGSLTALTPPRGHHLDRRARRLRIRVHARGSAEQTARVEVDHRGQMQLPTLGGLQAVGTSVMSPTRLAVARAAVKVPPEQAANLRRALVLPSSDRTYAWPDRPPSPEAHRVRGVFPLTSHPSLRRSP